jgi:nucleotide-binding universal stress UspA family protein
MFSRILVPLDGTPEAEAALPYATSIARACGSRVTCIHVLDLMSGFDMLRPIDPLALQLRKAEMEAYLRRVASALAESGLDADAEIVEGCVAEAIVTFCDRHAIDLVVLSHSGRGRSAVLGPHAFNVSLVVAHSGCASLLVLNARHPVAAEELALGFRRILVPLDGSQRAECVLPVVNQLAMASGGDVLLVHVVQPPEMPRRMPLSPQDSELVAEIVKRNRAEAVQYLDSLLFRLPDRAHDRVLVGGHSASLLHEVADQEDADLIVMSAHGYSAQTRWPYGSVAASFIEHGNRPLLLVQDAPVTHAAGSAETVATRLPLEIVPMDRLGGGE